MKCPYQTKVIHKPEYTERYVKHFAEDITIFCECVKSECPFYYTLWSPGKAERLGHCRRAESEECGKGGSRA
jgi:hypothetical protein